MSGQAYGSSGAGPGGCATDVNGCFTAAGIIGAFVLVGLALGALIDHLSHTVWPRLIVAIAICALVVAVAISSRRNTR